MVMWQWLGHKTHPSQRAAVPRRAHLIMIFFSLFVQLFQGVIMTAVSLRLDWATEARRAEALLAAHTALTSGVDELVRPPKLSPLDEGLAGEV